MSTSRPGVSVVPSLHVHACRYRRSTHAPPEGARLAHLIDAPPTDGLWEDGRTDQDQLGGLTYEQLERAMTLDETVKGAPLDELNAIANKDDVVLLEKYRQIRKANLHKMEPIPVCKIPN